MRSPVLVSTEDEKRSRLLSQVGGGYSHVRGGGQRRAKWGRPATWEGARGRCGGFHGGGLYHEGHGLWDEQGGGSPSKWGLRPLERFVPQAEARDDAGGYRRTRWNSVYNSQHYPHVLANSRNDFRTMPGSSRRQTTPNSTVGESPCTGL
jgi:hypothetical protein